MNKLSCWANFVGCNEDMTVTAVFAWCNERHENCEEQFFWNLRLGGYSGKDGRKRDLGLSLVFAIAQK